MNNYLVVILFIPIYFLSIVFTVYVHIMDLSVKDYESYRLQQVANFCADAAVEEMLLSDDLDLDYADLNKVKIDPNTALNTFSELFCLNYNLTASEENKRMVRTNYFKAFVVCAYDGYYKGTSTRVNAEGDHELVFTPKLPYSYAANGGMYALTLGKSACYFYKNGVVSKVANPFSETLTSYLISSKVSDDLMWTLEQQYEHGVYQTPYIPAKMSAVKGTNTLLGPTVMVFIDDFNITTLHKVQSFNVGATAITQAKAVIAYVRDGQNYYCYHDKLQAALGLDDVEMEQWIDTYSVDMFMSIEDAAKEGFYYDNLYMN